MPGTRSLALRFLSGPFRGGAVPIDRTRPLVIGRQSGSDVVIADELVSRHHARIAYDGDELVLEDLGSTNGTYLNGARVVDRVHIREGDRVLLGGSIAKVVVREAPASSPTLDERPAATELRRSSGMQGELEEVPLPDLLQLFGASRKTGLLVVDREGHTAELRLEKGRVVACVLDGREDLPAEKSFYRLLAWTHGHFELRAAPPTPPTHASSLAQKPMEALLMEGLRQYDELKRLRTTLPARFAPGSPPLPGTTPDDRALLVVAATEGELDAILDATPLPDLAVAERLAALVASGLLQPQ